MKKDLRHDLDGLVNVINKVLSQHNKTGKNVSVSRAQLKDLLFSEGGETLSARQLDGKDNITDRALGKLAETRTEWLNYLPYREAGLISSAEQNAFIKSLRDELAAFVDTAFPFVFNLQSLKPEEIVLVYLFALLCGDQLWVNDPTCGTEWQKANFNRDALITREADTHLLTEYLTRADDFNAFVLSGGAESGKLTLVKSFLYEERDSVLFLDGRRKDPFADVWPKPLQFIQRIPTLSRPEQAESAFPYRSSDKTDLLSQSIERNRGRLIFVIRDYQGSKEDLREAEALCKGIRVKLIVTTEQTFDVSQTHCLRLPPFAPVEMEKLFFQFNPVDTVGEEDRSRVRDLSFLLLGQPTLMKLIAIWYQTHCKKGDPSKALQELRARMNEYDLEHLDNDMKYRPSSKASYINTY